MMTEDLEFQISQYADGSLPVAERAALEALMRFDAGAQQALREYRTLDVHLSRLRTRPAIRWDRLADHLSNAVDGERRSGGRAAVAGRIYPVIGGWRARSAVAAVLVFSLAGVFLFRGHHTAPQAGPVRQSDSTAVVAGPQAEVAGGPAVADIKIGPSRALAQHLGSGRYADGVVTHGPSRVTITAGLTPPSPPHADQKLR